MSGLYEIQTGYECNCSCKFCITRDVPGKEPRQKPLEDIREEIDIAEREGAKDIAFMGGEVTLRSDLTEIISYADNKEFRSIIVETNGLKLQDRSYCKELVQSGMDVVFVSLQAPRPEVNNLLMENEAAYKRIMDGLKNLEDLPVRVEIQTVVTNMNYRLIPELAEELSGKVDVLNMIMLMPGGRAEKTFDSLAVKYEKVVPRLRESLQILEGESAEMKIKELPPCTAGKKVRKKIDLALEEVNYQELEAGDYVNTVDIMGKKKMEKCRDCIYRRKCNGFWKDYFDIFGTSEVNPVKKNL